MADHNSSGTRNAAVVTIVVAIITTLGGILVAYINHHDKGGSPSPHEPGPSAPQTPPKEPESQPPEALAPQMGPLLSDRGFMGGSDYKSLHLSDAAQCSDMCKTESRCVAMTFTGDQVCWLKQAKTELVQASGYTSAIKVHQ